MSFFCQIRKLIEKKFVCFFTSFGPNPLPHAVDFSVLERKTIFLLSMCNSADTADVNEAHALRGTGFTHLPGFMTIQSCRHSSEHSVGKNLRRSKVGACMRWVSTLSICALTDWWGRLTAARLIAADQRIYIDLWPNWRVLQQHGENHVYPRSNAAVCYGKCKLFAKSRWHRSRHTLASNFTCIGRLSPAGVWKPNPSSA